VREPVEYCVSADGKELKWKTYAPATKLGDELARRAYDEFNSKFSYEDVNSVVEVGKTKKARVSVTVRDFYISEVIQVRRSDHSGHQVVYEGLFRIGDALEQQIERFYKEDNPEETK